jgi:hypothetical protein
MIQLGDFNIVHNRIKKVYAPPDGFRNTQKHDFMIEIAVLMYDKLSKSISCGQ